MRSLAPHRVSSRRAWLSAGLRTAVAGSFAAQLWPVLIARGAEIHPLAARAPHFAPRARRVIQFFLTGGASHVDSFDPKPALQARHGQTLASAGKDDRLMASPWSARPRGQSGLAASDLFPHLGELVDELCLIRSMRGEQNDHFQATLNLHNGSNGSALPGIGAWVSYGLGTTNPNLPSYVVFAERQPYAGAQVWDSNFLPAYHQGLRVVPGDQPLPYLRPDQPLASAQRTAELALLEQWNRRHRGQRDDDPELGARMLSFTTAARLEQLAPELLDVSGESAATRQMYGVEPGDKRSFAWQTLVARRLSEAGVRYVELFDTGSSNNWDAHSNIQSHGRLAARIDRPIAALLRDLKQRGLLQDTLVIFSTEFGRTPYGTDGGRHHHCRAFTTWLAGGGVRAGYAHGGSDELGLEVAHDPVTVPDFHATILHLLGLDHEQLTYSYGGHSFRLTGVRGEVVRGVLG